MGKMGIWLTLVVSFLSTPVLGGDDLKRSGSFGAAMVDSAKGVEVSEVFAGSTADEAGVKPGDVLTAVAGSPVKTPGAAAAAIGKVKGGETLALEFVRDGAKLAKTVTLKERPRESAETFDVIYGSIPSKAGRLRTIVTRPRTPGKHPALFLIQGYGCYSVEASPGRPGGFKLIVDAFTEHGYVTLRVEKPGCGDSEGGPCSEVDFLTELDGYRQGLKMLKGLDMVDPAKILLFGHSLGGLWAPMVAADDPVKGVAVYGTVVKTWFEYELENRRRQLMLSGMSYRDVDRRNRQAELYLHALLIEKHDPERIVKDHPELAEYGREMSPDGIHVNTRSVEFLRQVADTPYPEAWSKLDAHVLAIWGTAEFISTEADHKMIADIVNQQHPGHAEFLALEGLDHGFYRASSPQDSFDKWGSKAPRSIDPKIVEALLAWAGRVLAP